MASRLTSSLAATLAIALALALGACSQPRFSRGADTGGEPRFKVGDPYKVRGIWYYPTEDYAYDKTGIASWYGRDFHGKKTANGEIYDMNEMTAAHKTLPMPSLVEVTNLDNGRRLRVRVNDRGPFAHGRIIDLSRGAARQLGFERSGTARVRVRILAAESRNMKARTQAARRGGGVVSSLPAVPRPRIQVQTLPPPTRGTAPPPAANPPASPGTGPVAPVPPRATRLFVQAGAFRTAENADRLAARLDALGPVLISPVEVGGVRYLRVRLGPLASVEEGDRLLARVIGAGFPNARLIVE